MKKSRLRRYALRRQRFYEDAEVAEEAKDEELAKALRLRAESDWNWAVERASYSVTSFRYFTF